MTESKSSFRLRALTDDYLALERKLKLGGGPEKIEKIHKQGKLTARERIDLLLDKDTYSQEIGLLVAYDEYNGQAPAAAVVTVVGKVNGRECVVVANDATIKAGAWYPETIKKILRAQEIAMRNRVPIVYLVDSAGVNLPYQGGVFPGQYGAARIFYYNSIMRHYLKVPQISAVMGMCVAGGAYLPALSDVILMVEGTSFMGLGGANLVKGATGQTIDNETLGGAMTHNSISGVAHFRTKDEQECVTKIRELITELPAPEASRVSVSKVESPKSNAEDLYQILPQDHRAPYDMHAVLNTFVEAMATAKVPKIVLTVNHASGAGYYAMAGQGFDPDFIFSLPTGRMGVMEGDSAAVAIHGTQIEKLKAQGKEPDAELLAQMDKVRETYDRELDAKHAAARGLVDAIVTPENLRESLILALQTCLNTSSPHIGPFVLP